MLWGEKTRSRCAQKADLVIVTAGTRVPQAFLVPRRDFYFQAALRNLRKHLEKHSFRISNFLNLEFKSMSYAQRDSAGWIFILLHRISATYGESLPIKCH